MLSIPLLSVPSQVISVMLGGQPCRLHIFQRTPGEVIRSESATYLATDLSEFIVTEDLQYIQATGKQFESSDKRYGGPSMFMDVYVNDRPIITGVICQNANRIVRDAYLGFIGDFVFLDMLGTADPQFQGLGTRWRLIYIEAGDI